MINNYNDLDLGRYMKVDAVLSAPADEIDKQVRIIAILADKTEKEVLALPLDEYAKCARQVAFLGRPCEPTEFADDVLEAGGFRLVPTRDFTKITTAQYVDFQTFAKGLPGTIPMALSCFLIPEGREYNDGYDIAAVQKAVLSLSVPEAVGLTAFFFKMYAASIADTLNSLGKRNPKARKEMLRMIEELQASFNKGGDGLQV